MSGRELFIRNNSQTGSSHHQHQQQRSRTGSVASTQSERVSALPKVSLAPRGSLDPNTGFLHPTKRSNSNSQLRWQSSQMDYSQGGVGRGTVRRSNLKLDVETYDSDNVKGEEEQEEEGEDDDSDDGKDKKQDREAARSQYPSYLEDRDGIPKTPPSLFVSRQPSNSSVQKYNTLSHLQGHRAVNIDDATVSIEFPENMNRVEKSNAISHHVIQNTSLSPLPPVNPAFQQKPSKVNRLKLGTGSSKASLYVRVVKPIVYKFLGTPISADSKRLGWWCFLIDIFHLFLLIIIPVQLAWTHHFTEIGWVVFYGVMDAIMLFDCWIQARIDYKDEYGLLVEDIELIAKRYLFVNHGVLEVFVSLPWEFLEFTIDDVELWGGFLGASPIGDPLTFYRRKFWAVILFIKIFLRAPYLRIYQIHLPSLALPISRLIKCMFILMLIGHVDACLFWFIDSTLLPGPDRWIEEYVMSIHSAAALASSAASTTTSPIPSSDEPIAVPMSTQYLVSYLSALRSLVLKLRECKRDAENIYVIFEFVAGILSYGTVFGNIHSILELMDSTAAVNQAEEYHNFEMEGIISFMKEKKLRPELQQMVRDYKELQWQKSKGLDEDHFFVGIPKSVQQEIKNFLYLELVQKVPIFQNTDTYFQQMLAFKIRPMHVLSGWTIFRKGDEGEEMFFIKSGQVEICSEDGTIIFVTLTSGAFFGEIALFESCHRTATARAKGNCELCTLTKEEFNILMNLYPTVAEGIRETIRLRKIVEEEKKRKAEEEAERLRMEEEDTVDYVAPVKRSILKLNGIGGRKQSSFYGLGGLNSPTSNTSNGVSISRRGSMMASFGVAKEPEAFDIDNMLVTAQKSNERLPRCNSERRKGPGGGGSLGTGGRRISFAE
ncbi:hypothetical protein BDR26DRAFT_919147 [Obelidium mucronatum]|nr:hypothetical protein BDR26DRAFT_919147 [Obelidium mucronatum]